MHDAAIIFVLPRECENVLSRIPAKSLLFVASRVAEYGPSGCRRVFIVEVIDLNLILFVEVILLKTGYQCSIEVKRESHYLGVVITKSLNQ